jgi:Cd2+/Zn2+-exporting ATPase
VINQNFLVGVFFIIGGLALAALGYLTPIVAAMMQNVGSLIVIFNSARLVRQGEELEPYVLGSGSGNATPARLSGATAAAG